MAACYDSTIRQSERTANFQTTSQLALPERLFML